MKISPGQRLLPIILMSTAINASAAHVIDFAHV